MTETRSDARWIPALPDLTTTDGEVLSEGHNGYWEPFQVVWLVIDEDGHHDVAVSVYTSQEQAEAAARRIADEKFPPLDRIHLSTIAELNERSELTDEMREDGWTLNIAYSVEGDCVRVQRASVQP